MVKRLWCESRKITAFKVPSLRHAQVPYLLAAQWSCRSTVTLRILTVRDLAVIVAVEGNSLAFVAQILSATYQSMPECHANLKKNVQSDCLIFFNRMEEHFFKNHRILIFLVLNFCIHVYNLRVNMQMQK